MPPRRTPLPPPIQRERRASAAKSFREPSENDVWAPDSDDESKPAAKRAKGSTPKFGTPLAAPASAGGSGSTAPSTHAAERLLAAESLHERCALAVEFLSELDVDGWFAEPVTDEIAPGYSEFVSEPMDLSTIKSKLEAGEYTGDGADDEAAVDAFASDVRLLYRNAVT